jgi:hypothetical protein
MKLMKDEGSRSLADLQDRLQLLRAEEAGQLEGLIGPRCKKSTVSVWFTHPTEREYRTWFLCENCDFSMRAQNVGQRAHYSKKRDRTGQDSTAAPALPAASESF